MHGAESFLRIKYSL